MTLRHRITTVLVILAVAAIAATVLLDPSTRARPARFAKVAAVSAVAGTSSGPSKVMVIAEENEEESAFIGSSEAPYLTQLNKIRAAHPALRQLRNLDVHSSDDGAMLVYSKYIAGEFTRPGKPDGIIVIANVDPHSVRETIVHLDVTKFGLEPGAEFEVKDLITDQKFTWSADNYVRLDAFTEPVHILSIDYR